MTLPTSLNGGEREMMERIARDLVDSYDEEIELELEDREIDEAGVVRGVDNKEARRLYFRELFRLQGELVKLQDWVQNTGQRVVSRYVDAVTGKPIEENDEVKGFASDPEHVILLEDDELAAVGLESTRTIDIDMFVPRDSIPWIFLDSPYFLLPEEAVAEEAYAVIREAMAATNMVGISRVVLNRRERAVMLEPNGKGIMVWTLRYGDEVRKAGPYFEGVGKAAPDGGLMKLAGQLIKQKTKHWSPEMVKDPVQEHLLKLIASKQSRSARHAQRAAGEPARPGNVVNLFDALKQSLAGEKPAKRQPGSSKV